MKTQYILMNKEENRIHCVVDNVPFSASGDLTIMNSYSPFKITIFESKLKAWGKGIFYDFHLIKLKEKDYFSWDSIGIQGSYTYIKNKESGMVYRLWLESEWQGDSRTTLSRGNHLVIQGRYVGNREDFVELDWN